MQGGFAYPGAADRVEVSSNGGYLVNAALFLVTTVCLAGGQTTAPAAQPAKPDAKPVVVSPAPAAMAPAPMAAPIAAAPGCGCANGGCDSGCCEEGKHVKVGLLSRLFHKNKCETCETCAPAPSCGCDTCEAPKHGGKLKGLFHKHKEECGCDSCGGCDGCGAISGPTTGIISGPAMGGVITPAPGAKVEPIPGPKSDTAPKKLPEGTKEKSGESKEIKAVIPPAAPAALEVTPAKPDSPF